MEGSLKDIWEKVRNGDQIAFRTLFDHYYEDLVRFAVSHLYNRDEAEDVVQQFFVYLWENASHLIITRSLQSYLFLSVRNRCLNALRSKNVRDKNELLFVDGFLDYLSQEDAESLDLEEKLLKSLQALPPRMKQIIELKYFGKKKINEISQLLGISSPSVKTQLQRGKSKIKSFLDRSGS